MRLLGHLSRNCDGRGKLQLVETHNQEGTPAVAMHGVKPNANIMNGAHGNKEDGWTEVKNRKSRQNLNSKKPPQPKSKPVTTSKAKLKGALNGQVREESRGQSVTAPLSLVEFCYCWFICKCT